MTHSNVLVYPLSSLSSFSPQERLLAFGGKAVGLHFLNLQQDSLPSDLSYRVPDAYAIHTNAFLHHIERAFSQLPSSQLRRASSNDLDALAVLVRKIPLDPICERELREVFDKLTKPVAVRSSATIEDGQHSAWAGQGLTKLHLSTFEEVRQAVREVWASMLSEQAILYEPHRRLSAPPPLMGVVIQSMVVPLHDPSPFSGVLFTRNPLAGDNQERLDTRELLVSLVHQIGDDVVAGHDGHTFRLITSSHHLSPLPPPRVIPLQEDNPPLDEPLRTLFSLLCSLSLWLMRDGAPSISHDSQRPVELDIEWAFCSGTLFLLQARPITKTNGDSQPHLFTNTNVAEALPGVASPMTWSVIYGFADVGFSAAFGILGIRPPDCHHLVKALNGRIYLNLSLFLELAGRLPFLTPERVFSMAGGNWMRLESFQENHPRSPVSFLKILKSIKTLSIAGTLASVSRLSLPFLASKWSDHVVEWSKKTIYHLEEDHLWSPQSLIELQHLIDEEFEQTGILMLAASADFLILFATIHWLLEQSILWVYSEPEHREVRISLLKNLESTIMAGIQVESSRPGNALIELAKAAKSSPLVVASLRTCLREQMPSSLCVAKLEAVRNRKEAESERFFLLYDQFMELFGTRSVHEAELATARWREDPRFLFSVLCEWIDSDALVGKKDRKSDPDPFALIDSLQEHAPNRLRPLLSLLPHLLAQTHRAAKRRELLRARVVDSLAVIRAYLLAASRTMLAAGAIQNEDDIFFLSYEDVHHWLTSRLNGQPFNLRYRLLVRRFTYQHYLLKPDLPNLVEVANGRTSFPVETSDLPDSSAVMGSDPGHEEHDSNSLVHNGSIFIGIAASTGCSTGPARVISDPRQQLVSKPGEILVMPYADIGSTPLFLTAAGVVTERGGPLCHAAIVAREYGTPMVVNVPNLLRHIRTGDFLLVDGDRGIVTKLDHALSSTSDLEFCHD